jgi:hypothetical protein
MLFIHKYPDAYHLQQFHEEGDTIVYFAGQEEPCYQCKILTPWYSISLGMSVCSEECLQYRWQTLIDSL